MSAKPVGSKEDPRGLWLRNCGISSVRAWGAAGPARTLGDSFVQVKQLEGGVAAGQAVLGPVSFTAECGFVRRAA